MVITRNNTWAHVHFSRPPTGKSRLLVKGEGCDHGRGPEASSVGSCTESGNDKSESSREGVEMMTFEVDDTESEKTPLVSERAVSTG